MKRPLSVSIIGWLLVVLGVISIVTILWSYRQVGANPRVAALMASSPLSPALQETIGVIGSVVNIAAGILLLKRIEAGRLIYVVWTVLTLLLSLWSSPVKVAIIPGLILFAVVTFFLFRRPVTAWFRADARP